MTPPCEQLDSAKAEAGVVTREDVPRLARWAGRALRPHIGQDWDDMRADLAIHLLEQRIGKPVISSIHFTRQWYRRDRLRQLLRERPDGTTYLNLSDSDELDSWHPVAPHEPGELERQDERLEKLRPLLNYLGYATERGQRAILLTCLGLSREDASRVMGVCKSGVPQLLMTAKRHIRQAVIDGLPPKRAGNMENMVPKLQRKVA